MHTIEDLIKTKPIEDPYLRAILNLLYTSNWFQTGFNHALKPYGLTEPQFNVLRILRGRGEQMNLYEIQDRMIQKMSNVSRLIDKLLEKGLVERKECEQNRRRVDITITEKGLTLLEDVQPVLERQMKDLHENISREEVAQLSTLIEKLRG